MAGFEEERLIAKAAIESLGLTPVMAENFGARPHSSQQVCLEGVQESDCYLGIFGERYGFVSKSGRSITHEEFDEARKRAIPTLLVVKKPAPKRDPALADFLKSTGSYEDGLYFGNYHTHTDLATAVTRALNTLVNRSAPGANPQAANAKLREILKSDSRHPQNTSISLIVVPADRTELLDVRLLSSEDFHRSLRRALRYDVPVFNEELGTKVLEESDCLVLVQEGAYATPLNRFILYPDRTVVLTLSLDSSDTKNTQDYLSNSIIDETHLQDRLANCLLLSAEVEAKLLPPPRTQSFFVQAALSSLSGKQLGRRPSQRITSLSMGGFVDDPLLVPSPPLRVAVGKLAEATDLADQLREHFARMFRAANAYFRVK